MQDHEQRCGLGKAQGWTPNNNGEEAHGLQTGIRSEWNPTERHRKASFQEERFEKTAAATPGLTELNR
jgi:hypothetical protein